MTEVNALVNHWLSHRKVLLELLDLIPNDKAQFQPWKGALTLGGLAAHMASSADMFVSAVKTGRLEPPSRPENIETMEQVCAYVHEVTDKTALEFSLLTDDQLSRVVEAKHMFGFDLPGKTFLHTMREHEIHHKGQLFVYARLVGVEKVPFFISRG